MEKTWSELASKVESSTSAGIRNFVDDPMVQGVAIGAVAVASFVARGKIFGAAEKLFPRATEMLTETAEKFSGKELFGEAGSEIRVAESVAPINVPLVHWARSSPSELAKDSSFAPVMDIPQTSRYSSLVPSKFKLGHFDDVHDDVHMDRLIDKYGPPQESADAMAASGISSRSWLEPIGGTSSAEPSVGARGFYAPLEATTLPVPRVGAPGGNSNLPAEPFLHLSTKWRYGLGGFAIGATGAHEIDKNQWLNKSLRFHAE